MILTFDIVRKAFKIIDSDLNMCGRLVRPEGKVQPFSRENLSRLSEKHLSIRQGTGEDGLTLTIFYVDVYCRAQVLA